MRFETSTYYGARDPLKLSAFDLPRAAPASERRETTVYEPFEREKTGNEPFERETTGHEPFERGTTGYEPFERD